MTSLLPEASTIPGSTELPPTVLVVDAAPAARSVTARKLSDGLGLKVIGAADGRDALQVLERELLCLVVTDLRMPGMGGLELVEHLQTARPGLPVIVVAAHGSEDLALRALRAGAASYVPRRQMDELLVSTAESVLASARQERRRGKVFESLCRLACDYELENNPVLVPAFIAHVQEQMARMKACDEGAKIRVGVALEEALLNGLYHGNLELSSDLRQDGGDTFQRLARERRKQAPYVQRRLHVRVEITRQECSFRIRDEGPGFDTHSVPDPTDPENLLRCSGRGLLLIRTFMDEVTHNDAGNQIRMVKRRSPA
jgi:CheY-like chemotaxis protein